MELGKVPPNDVEAEQAIIGSMLTDKDAVISAVEVLKADDFYREDNKIIYEAILNLYSRSEPIDIITVKSELESMGKIDQVGCLEYLAELPEKVPTTANVEKYISIVKEKSELRRLIKAANEIIEQGYDPTENIDDIMNSAEKKIFNIMQDKDQKSYSPIKDVLIDAFTELEQLYNQKQHITGVPTGFIDLDYKTAGLHGSELILIAARPAMGKSAFALNIAANAALNANTPVAIFSLEMSKEQLVTRMIALDSLVNSQKIQTGQLVDDEWDKIMESTEVIADAPIFVDDNSAITVADLRSKCRKLKQNNDLGLIIIDYLQLMSTNKHVESRQQFISDTSRALKVLARELNVPVITLSQLNRAVDSRPDHKPVLADLRESGAIEQDADVVMFIYRDDYYNPDTEKKGIAEIIIAKQRKGATGSVDLVWMQDYTKFANKEHPQM